MTSVNLYLNFPGSTEEVFNFYKSVFGGEFATLQRFKEMPDGDKLPPVDRDKILHVALPIGNGNILMGSDTLGSMGQNLVSGSNFHVSISAGSEEEAHNLFNQLSAGGEVRLPIQRMFWGALFGMLQDKFGIQWMVSFDENYAQ